MDTNMNPGVQRQEIPYYFKGIDGEAYQAD
jgi:hypothetical protein